MQRTPTDSFEVEAEYDALLPGVTSRHKRRRSILPNIAEWKPHPFWFVSRAFVYIWLTFCGIRVFPIVAMVNVCVSNSANLCVRLPAKHHYSTSVVQSQHHIYRFTRPLLVGLSIRQPAYLV
jgi:hypothetical protein